MEIFEKIKYNNYALWIGDNINKKLNIPTKNELALKIYRGLHEDIKEKVANKERLTEVSQIFLDSATGNMMNLISFLNDELELEGKSNPYSYLSQISEIDTIITHDHSEILESIWKDGEIHNIFCEKKITRSNINLFKILGDYRHTERIILTSQNMRKIKKLKLYDHFWKKLNGALKDKNLILLGVNLDEDTKDILTLVFSKINLSNTARYFVTSNPVSMEDESWLISNEFEFIYEDDLNFIKKMALYFNNENINPIHVEIEVEMVEDREKIQAIEVEENNRFQKSELDTENLEENLEKVMVKEKISENKEEKQLKMFEKEEVLVIDEKSENLEIEPIKEEYTVENLEILLYLNGNTLKGEIIETEVRNRQRRLVEFREKRSPAYKVDDFSEINHYKALEIKIPFESADLPQIKLEKKKFTGKVDIRCNDQTIYHVSLKSHVSGKYQVVDFKNHDFYLRLLLDGDNVMRFTYKISENTVNIKGRNIYIFFKNLFGGFELNFKNKKISGNFKIISDEDMEKLDIILETIDRYLSIKNRIKIRNINLKELLKNTRSLQVLFSYYNNTPKVTTGNITIRTNFSGDTTEVENLVLSYPVTINFLGFTRSFIESTEIEIDGSNITHVGDQLEVQAFNIIQNITYKEIIE
ncbi:SIR2 family protein [Psychrilyobacter sp.]|uniref:SIR2 family protein n=1 Tax=Psychrilyobacter sp. TaxID=2586924 RepID=UPI0030171B6F